MTHWWFRFPSFCWLRQQKWDCWQAQRPREHTRAQIPTTGINLQPCNSSALCFKLQNNGLPWIPVRKKFFSSPYGLEFGCVGHLFSCAFVIEKKIRVKWGILLRRLRPIVDSMLKPILDPKSNQKGNLFILLKVGKLIFSQHTYLKYFILKI